PRTPDAPDAARIEAWADEQRARARTGRLYAAVPFFLAAGTAP
ncbi:SAM-dependent methyltransferase, partial [Streptomyces sp. SID2563]|nr:SAM-dependent methyltransferase [Streptomyces sp. SID2563]